MLQASLMKATGGKPQWISPGENNRFEKDRKLTRMVSVMVRNFKQIVLPEKAKNLRQMKARNKSQRNNC